MIFNFKKFYFWNAGLSFEIRRRNGSVTPPFAVGG